MALLTLDINGVCNQRCTFCYADLNGSYLPSEEISSLVASSDSERVQIGGGEPLLDRRIAEIIKEIRARGKLVHISTNASVIPAKILDLDKDVRGGIQVQVSIHGSNPDLYERIHGVDLFDAVVRNTLKLTEYFSTVMSSCVYGENLSDVPNLVDLSGRIGIPHRFNLVYPVGKGSSVRRLDRREVEKLRGDLLQHRVLTNGRVDSPIIHMNNCYVLESAYDLPRSGSCPADCGKVYVSPSRTSSCEFLGSKSVGEKNGN